MTGPTPLDPIDPSDLTPVPDLATLRLPVGPPPPPPAEGTIRLEAEGIAEALSTGALPDQTLQLKTGPPPPPPPPGAVSPVPSPYTTHELPPPAVRRRTGRWAILTGGVLLAAVLGGLALFRPGLLGLGTPREGPPAEADAQAEAELPPATASQEAPREAEVPPALRSYHEKALKGDANAMAVLGTMYYNGLNVPADRAEGLKWLRRAADAGNAAAKKQLAQLDGR